MEGVGATPLALAGVLNGTLTGTISPLAMTAPPVARRRRRVIGSLVMGHSPIGFGRDRTLNIGRLRAIPSRRPLADAVKEVTVS